MDESTTGRLQAAVVSGIFFVVGLAIGGYLLGAQIKDTKLGDRYVTVRGLTERTVKADVAVWNLDFKEAGDDLPSVYARSEQDKAVTLKFLTAQGIAAQDITTGAAKAIDRQTNEYGNGEKGPRYIVDQSISVLSKNVDGVASAAQKASALVQQGVVLTGQSGVQYNFTGLNSIKPDMITEATKNARSAADRFAADSGSKVGAIRRAEQGVFTITGANEGAQAQNPEDAGADNSGGSDLMKKVRIVTTVDYYLER
jgi:hypothetical protein